MIRLLLKRSELWRGRQLLKAFHGRSKGDPAGACREEVNSRCEGVAAWGGCGGQEGKLLQLPLWPWLHAAPLSLSRVHHPAPGAAGTGPIAGMLGAWLRHSWHRHGAISSVSEVVRLLPPLPLSNPFSAAFKTQPLCSWNCGWLPATGLCFDFKDVGFAPFYHKVQTGTAWLRQNKFCPGIKGGQLFLRLLPAAALLAARCLRPGSANR